MQSWFTRSSISPTYLSSFELRITRWIMTAALFSTVGCGSIAQAPGRSISTSAGPATESPSDNPPVHQWSFDSPSSAPRSPETQDASPPPIDAAPTTSTVTETGLASWYGAKHHGKRTASGEIFDQNKFTAAHRTLPWGSIVKVTNLDNGKSVEVRINDRGPYTKARVIDLSRAAARALAMVKSGVSPVRIELLSPREISSDLALQNGQSRWARDGN